MKLKCLIILIILFVMFQLVSATDCEISTDNITFTGANNNATYDGIIDETEDICSIRNLNCSTLYYIRLRTPTTSWNYSSIRTEPCGVNQMEIAIILILLGAAAILIYAALNVKDDLLKMLFMVMSFIMIVLGLNVATHLEDITSTLQNTLEIGYFIFLYGGLFFLIVYLIILFIRNIFEKKRRTNLGEDDFDEED